MLGGATGEADRYGGEESLAVRWARRVLKKNKLEKSL
jgi:hypothetical protein